MISANLAAVRERMERAAVRAGRDPGTVALVAVSKTFGPDVVTPVIAGGQRVFGENRVQEAKGKWPALRALHRDLELHLVGPLQTNKAGDAVALFDVIETVDRERLAGILAEEMARAGKSLPCFVQVNIGGEEQKAGIAVAEAVDFVARCRDGYGLDIVGLMCIPPDGQPAGPYFALLAELGRAAGVEKLSMGMSGDFEAAVEEGATLVRVGTAIFGERNARR